MAVVAIVAVGYMISRGSRRPVAATPTGLTAPTCQALTATTRAVARRTSPENGAVRPRLATAASSPLLLLAAAISHSRLRPDGAPLTPASVPTAASGASDFGGRDENRRVCARPRASG